MQRPASAISVVVLRRPPAGVCATKPVYWALGDPSASTSYGFDLSVCLESEEIEFTVMFRDVVVRAELFQHFAVNLA
ncbi:hypothetical protein HK405_012524, partial [Cladochytrium tenue]